MSSLNTLQMDIMTLAQQSTLDEIQESLENVIEIAELSVWYFYLGGMPSVFVDISLDNKENWQNGIYQNSRYSQFAIHQDMKLEQISKHYLLGKHRKCKIKTVQDVVAKIKKWAESQPDCVID